MISKKNNKPHVAFCVVVRIAAQFENDNAILFHAFLRKPKVSLYVFISSICVLMLHICSIYMFSVVRCCCTYEKALLCPKWSWFQFVYAFPIHHVKSVYAMNAHISICTFASIWICGIYGIWIYSIYGIYGKSTPGTLRDTPGTLPECSGSALSVYSVNEIIYGIHRIYKFEFTEYTSGAYIYLLNIRKKHKFVFTE